MSKRSRPSVVLAWCFTARFRKKRLFFMRPELKAFTSTMLTRSALLPLLLAFSVSTCKKHENLAASPQHKNPPRKALGLAQASPTITAAATSPRWSMR